MTPERLAEIDRELDAFGKSAAELARVIARARAGAADLAGDDALSTLLAEATAAAASAAEGARAEIAAAAPVRPPITEHVPVERPGPATRAQKERPAPFEEEPDTAVMSAAKVEAAAGSADIAGLSVDELFADAEPVAPGADAGGLADLFDDEASAGQEPSPDGGLDGLFEDDEPTTVGSLADLFGESEELPLGDDDDVIESARTSGAPEELRLSDPDVQAVDPPPSRPLTMPPPLPAHAALDLFGDEDDEETNLVSAANVARMRQGAPEAAEPEPLDDDDFELLVDEDVLELDPDAAEEDEAAPKKPGLLGRLLGKK